MSSIRPAGAAGAPSLVSVSHPGTDVLRRLAGAAVVTAGLLLLGPVANGSSLVAQERILDEGTFELQLDGRAAGTETFSIRRIGAGSDAKILATAVVELEREGGTTEMRPILKTSAEQSPLEYQNKVRGLTERDVRFEAADSRFVARIQSPAGIRERELRATPGAIFLEELVAHQYYFLPSRRAGGEETVVPVIRPDTGDRLQGTLTTLGTEELRIAGRAHEATKARLVLGGEEHLIWFGPEGRVLRVEIPGRGYVAERQEP